MNAFSFHVLRLLADGRFRSGEALARDLRISRATVWNALRGVEEIGLQVFRVRGRGYRLAQPLILLDAGEIERQLGAHASRFALHVVDRAVSTNTLLSQRAAAGAATGSIIVAEWQTNGRGRRGRVWHSAPGAALTFSLLWRFEQGAGFLSGLSLAAGIAIVRTLALLGVHDAGLKWPNDVLWHGRKLAGILIEMQGDTLGPSAAVIGIGLNCRLPAMLRTRIDQPAVDLEEVCGTTQNRNRALALLLLELARVLETFARDGFAPLREEWQRRHIFQRQPVELALPDGTLARGIAEGVADDGALLLATKGGRRRFHSGELNPECEA